MCKRFVDLVPVLSDRLASKPLQNMDTGDDEQSGDEGRSESEVPVDLPIQEEMSEQDITNFCVESPSTVPTSSTSASSSRQSMDLPN